MLTLKQVRESTLYKTLRKQGIPIDPLDLQMALYTSEVRNSDGQGRTMETRSARHDVSAAVYFAGTPQGYTFWAKVYNMQTEAWA